MSKKNLQALKSLKRNYLILFILFTVLIFALIYNSCSSEGSKSVKFSKILNNLGPGFSVTINNGSYATQEKNVTLKFEVPRKNLRGEVVDYEMKVSRNSDCSDGEWEEYKPTKGWNLDNRRDNSNIEIEKKYFTYTKFREKRPENVNYVLRSGAAGESDCVHDSIVYDTRPPRLSLTKQPDKITGQRNAHFMFSGEDFEGGGISFQCRIGLKGSFVATCGHSQGDDNSLWKPCLSLEYRQSLTLNQTKEEFRFSLKGTDAAGNCKILEYDWTIDQTIPSIVLHCPETNSNKETGKIKATLSASDRNKNDTFSLRCKKNNQNNQFGDCNCQVSNSCTAITKASPEAFIQKESFIKERLDEDGGYHKYSLSVQLENTQSRNLSNPETCVWYVDSEAPKVTLDLLTAATKKYNQDGKFKFSVSDNSDFRSTGVEVTLNYKIEGIQGNNQPKTCSTKSEDCIISVKDMITPGIESPKQYTLSVTAKDLVGNESLPETLIFHVMSGIDKLKKIHTVTQSSGKVDILFVLDDSGSMKDEAAHLGDSFSGIINSLSTLDWQIAVTSMELTKPSKFGKLVPLIDHETNQFLNNKKRYILSSEESCQAPLYCDSNKNTLELIFKRTITKGSRGHNNFVFMGGSEYGIQSVNTLLLNYSPPAEITTPDYTPQNSNETKAINSFFRENSTFVVIFIADEKNCGDGIQITTCHNDAINQHENLINKVMRTFDDDKKFISYPIIPKPGKGYRNRYPIEDLDDYLKLAKTTQGRSSKIGDNPVVWVDVEPTASRTSCSGISSSGIYTQGLCAISEDISTVERSSISLLCTNPILDAPHKITYSYTNQNTTNEDDSSFTTLPPKDELNQLKITDSNGQTHTIKVTEPSPTNRTNRILIKSTTPRTDIPYGTYRVEYSCPSKEKTVYAIEKNDVEDALNTLQQTPPSP